MPSVSLDVLSHRDSAAPPARRWPSWLLPLAVLAGFIILFLVLFRERLLPLPVVKVAAVLVAPGENILHEKMAVSSPATMLFQASGWVEPEPYAVKVSALVDGIVATVQVLEGQTVKKGDIVATLIDDDARLKLATAEGRHRALLAARTVHVASIKVAGFRRDTAQAELHAAETLVEEAGDLLKRFKSLGEGAVSQSDVTVARLRVQREEAGVAAARAKQAEYQAEIVKLEAETRTQDEEIALAEVAVAQERLAMERTRISAPMNGRVLRLMAAPGDKRMLAMDHPESSVIAMLYDPEHLQIRVDVPLADAAKLQVGQKARVHCSILPEQVMHGEVSRISGEADLQRNTLQAKVKLLNAASLLRPEMLCRVEFLGNAAGAESLPGDETTAHNMALWVPQAALRDGAVWVYDADTHTVSRRIVRLISEQRDNYLRIQDGLRAGERVVLSPDNLREGLRVTPSLSQP